MIQRYAEINNPKILIDFVGTSGSGKTGVILALANKLKGTLKLLGKEKSNPDRFKWVTTRSKRGLETLMSDEDLDNRFIDNPDRSERERIFKSLNLEHQIRHPDLEGGNLCGFRYYEINELLNQGPVLFSSPVKEVRTDVDKLKSNIPGLYVVTIGLTSDKARNQSQRREKHSVDKDQRELLKKYRSIEERNFEKLYPQFNYLVHNQSIDERLLVHNRTRLYEQIDKEVRLIEQIVLWEMLKASLGEENKPFTKPSERNQNIREYLDFIWKELTGKRILDSRGQIIEPDEVLQAIYALTTDQNYGTLKESEGAKILDASGRRNLQVSILPREEQPGTRYSTSAAIGIPALAYGLKLDNQTTRTVKLDDRFNSPTLKIHAEPAPNSLEAHERKIKPKIKKLWTRHVKDKTLDTKTPIPTKDIEQLIDLELETIRQQILRKVLPWAILDEKRVSSGFYPYDIRRSDNKNTFEFYREPHFIGSGVSINLLTRCHEILDYPCFIDEAEEAVKRLHNDLPKLRNHPFNLIVIGGELIPYYKLSKENEAREIIDASIETIKLLHNPDLNGFTLAKEETPRVSIYNSSIAKLIKFGIQERGLDNSWNEKLRDHLQLLKRDLVRPDYSVREEAVYSKLGIVYVAKQGIDPNKDGETNFTRARLRYLETLLDADEIEEAKLVANSLIQISEKDCRIPLDLNAKSELRYDTSTTLQTSNLFLDLYYLTNDKTYLNAAIRERLVLNVTGINFDETDQGMIDFVVYNPGKEKHNRCTTIRDEREYLDSYQRLLRISKPHHQSQVQDPHVHS